MLMYLNGQIIREEEAVISPFDHGFMYGLGLFETFRTYNGHPFLLDDHFDRLHRGLDQMRIENARYDRQETARIIASLLDANNMDDAYFRWNVSAGNAPVGLRTSPYKNPNTMVFVKGLPENGVREKKLHVLKQKRNTPEGPERLKSHHYLNSILGKYEMSPDQKGEGLFLTGRGHVAEGVVSNVFWRKGMNVYTPDPDCGILNGVTRQFVIRLARSKGFKVHEGHYMLNALLEADEAVITNSIQEIVAVSSVGEQMFPGVRGELYEALTSLYGRATREERLWSGKEWEER
ncbi:aminodeoxychorismate lyase [Alteribacter keqinensis]|uniref:4-amino-4-deoxychorismate lyase n=1 Tax=Alteribacter keqinensis TaxID=2483800 RepID=A0A3M7TKT0_9BACI|nr:aminodeoxychorismate lyase [Alteribacter keqinensis]RNA66016.1 4-amino-4-deoxychorismate lyase [Alteribacter keqinensis]